MISVQRQPQQSRQPHGLEGRPHRAPKVGRAAQVAIDNDRLSVPVHSDPFLDHRHMPVAAVPHGRGDSGHVPRRVDGRFDHRWVGHASSYARHLTAGCGNLGHSDQRGNHCLSGSRSPILNTLSCASGSSRKPYWPRNVSRPFLSQPGRTPAGRRQSSDQIPLGGCRIPSLTSAPVRLLRGVLGGAAACPSMQAVGWRRGFSLPGPRRPSHLVGHPRPSLTSAPLSRVVAGRDIGTGATPHASSGV